ncbi:FG-GAP repeat protein [Halostella litorea]|uniref:FG-GAP repeat protein n=1 Tax=Halostella litorea TaxID=2528831 RepID=UPI001091ED68|nr:FG-GAP repeat protein [Halostella litorea]
MHARTVAAALGTLAVLAVAAAGAGAAVPSATADGLQESNGSENDSDAPLSPHATVRGGPAVGESVAGGDADGDGTGDVAVGQPFADGAGGNAGAAYLFFGPIDGGERDAADADVTVEGTGGGEWTGYDVALADLNGDGVDDLVVTAPLRDTGYVYVFYGGPSLSGTLTPADADAVLAGEGDEQFGLSVAAVPNGSGDGAGLLVGAPRSDAGATDAGAAYYFEDLPAEGTSGDAALALVGTAESGRAGWDVAGGDVDGDGTPELFAGARDAGGSGAGAVYGVAADQTGTVSAADAAVTIRGAESGDRAGSTVALADRNGSAGLVVGAPTASPNGSDSGAVYVVPPADADLSAVDPAFVGAPGERAGWDATAGDLTCDGRADLLVGAPYAAGTAGATYLVPADGDASRVLTGESEGDLSGYRVGLVANATGEGTRDALVGAPHENTTGVNGSATLLAGECAVETEPASPNGTTTTGTTTADGTDGTTDADGTDPDDGTDATDGGGDDRSLVPGGPVAAAAGVAVAVVALALWRYRP